MTAFIESTSLFIHSGNGPIGPQRKWFTKAAQTVMAACFLHALAGCGPSNVKTTTMPDVQNKLVTLTDAEKKGLMSGTDSASIACVTLDSEPILIVWSDAPSCSNGVGSAASGLMTPHGELIYRGRDMKPNREIAYFGEIHSRDKGQITINGESYDLARGALFLVSGMDGDVQVKQLSRDVSKLKLELDHLLAFGKADPEITGFFSKPANPK